MLFLTTLKVVLRSLLEQTAPILSMLGIIIGLER